VSSVEESTAVAAVVDVSCRLYAPVRRLPDRSIVADPDVLPVSDSPSECRPVTPPPVCDAVRVASPEELEENVSVSESV
jgi:hypothetical protein